MSPWQLENELEATLDSVAKAIASIHVLAIERDIDPYMLMDTQGNLKIVPLLELRTKILGLMTEIELQKYRTRHA